ncbi:hypothetical protein ATCC90586_009750 [Pythium insidiosum]|nr:hypothetical protein ATCC90586_009750 [Pythium insidiosum]
MPRTLWRALFGLDGLFGLHGRHFEAAFRVREVLEIALQTYQLYYLSRSVATAWINHLAVSIIVVNCVGVAVLEQLPGLRARQRRLVHMLFDMILDVGYAVVLPLCITLPFLQEFEWAKGRVSYALWMDDAWNANAVASLRQLLVSSPLDLVSSVLPHVSFLGALSSLKQLLPRIHARRTQSHAPVALGSVINAFEPRQPTVNDLIGVSRSAIESSSRCSRQRLLAAIVHVLLFVWAGAVLAMHLDAQHVPTAVGCRRQLRAWRDLHGRNSAPVAFCSVMQINCRKDGLSGAASELTDRLEMVDRSILTKLVFAHCPALEMPPILTEFHQMTGIETYNCTLTSWSHEAPLTRTKHPGLTMVWILFTDMASFPPALLRDDLPPLFNNFVVHGSNLTELPDGLGSLWSALQLEWFALEHTAVSVVPPSLGLLHTQALQLLSNRITEVPDSLLLTLSGLRTLWLSGNPLERLPTSIGSLESSLIELRVEDTAVSSAPEWLVEWLAASRDVSLFGSPVCGSLPAMLAARACGQSLGTSRGSLPLDLLAHQRAL